MPEHVFAFICHKNQSTFCIVLFCFYFLFSKTKERKC